MLQVGEEVLLADMRRRCYQYFLDAADPETGFIADRGRRDGSGFSKAASSAACGFGLAAHAVAPSAGLATETEAAERCHRLLHSLLNRAEHHQGFVYHFFDCRDGRRRMRSEASTVDTALMLAGVMCASTRFADHPGITSLSQDLIHRTQWRAMLGEGDVLHMGWTPEQGILPYRWDRFSEGLLLILMAIGADSHGISPRCWHAWRRDSTLTHQGEPFLSYPPLFVHQYPVAFFDLRRFQSPDGWNFWRNSVLAHHAQIDFLTELGKRYSESMGHYGQELWGITSSDSKDGYRDWGGPYQDGRYEPDRGIDGTVVPSAAAGGLAIVPRESLRTLTFQRERFGDSVYGPYGFANAFHPANGWVSRDVIAIDTGISLLMAENLRAESVWKLFMKHPLAQAALQRSGFSQTDDQVDTNA